MHKIRGFIKYSLGIAIFVCAVVVVFVVTIGIGVIVEKKKKDKYDKYYINRLHIAYESNTKKSEDGLNMERYMAVKKVLIGEESLEEYRTATKRVEYFQDRLFKNTILRAEIESERMYIKYISFFTCAFSIIAGILKIENSLFDLMIMLIIVLN